MTLHPLRSLRSLRSLHGQALTSFQVLYPPSLYYSITERNTISLGKRNLLVHVSNVINVIDVMCLLSTFLFNRISTGGGCF